jgi:hypothetical protein
MADELGDIRLGVGVINNGERRFTAGRHRRDQLAGSPADAAARRPGGQKLSSDLHRKPALSDPARPGENANDRTGMVLAPAQQLMRLVTAGSKRRKRMFRSQQTARGMAAQRWCGNDQRLQHLRPRRP